MADILRIHNPGNYPMTMARIKKLWRDGEVKITGHAQQRMTQRQIDMLDIQNCILLGRIIGHSKPGPNWRYEVAGKAVDGDSMKCVVEINGRLIVITVM